MNINYIVGIKLVKMNIIISIHIVCVDINK